jgi:shikimate kinase
VKARATCGGAATIVNAVATGNGAAFGLALRATAIAETVRPSDGVRVVVPRDASPALAEACARRVLQRSRGKTGVAVSVESEIPISRGLKSSSAVANAVVSACAQALGLDLDPFEIIRIGVDAALETGVTITGAFDDACASFFGGIAVTDNRARKVLVSDRWPEGLVAVVHVPHRMITKPSLKGVDFAPIRPQVDEAFRLALRRDYVRAIQANSAAYAPVLGIDEGPAIRARAAGAMAAGITGTGPAIVALAKRARVDAVRRAMADGEAEVRVVALNPTGPREVVA